MDEQRDRGLSQPASAPLLPHAPHAMTVLKITCESAIHRIQLSGEPDYPCIQKAVQELWPNSSLEWMKYMDEEGDFCTLVEATFTDFVQTAQESNCGRQILKVQVARLPLVLPSEDLDLLAEYVDVEAEVQEQKGEPREEANDSDSFFLDEDWEFVDHGWDLPNSSSCATSVESPADLQEAEDDTMKEIQAELERIKAACEAELERHLDEWLQTPQAAGTYEDWIAAVHPENVKERLPGGPVIDPRMYLEGSFHRQLWNLRIEAMEDLDEITKQRCCVCPREPGNAGTMHSS